MADQLEQHRGLGLILAHIGQIIEDNQVNLSSLSSVAAILTDAPQPAAPWLEANRRPRRQAEEWQCDVRIEVAIHLN